MVLKNLPQWIMCQLLDSMITCRAGRATNRPCTAMKHTDQPPIDPIDQVSVSDADGAQFIFQRIWTTQAFFKLIFSEEACPQI
jgi:hypothetical protein